MNQQIRERGAWIARNILPHEPQIRSWLNRSHPQGLDVDDIIQEMYARIVSLDSYDAVHNPKQYAFRVAYSVVVDYTRRARIVSIFSVGNVEDLGLATTDANPEQRLTFQDEIDAVMRVMAQLPERTRNVLMLRRVTGLSQRETADRLAVTEKTVEKHLARGVLMLMNHFGRGGKVPPQTSQSNGDMRRGKSSDGHGH